MTRLLLAALLLLPSCVTRPQTASGRPEVTVRLDAKAAKSRIVQAYSAAGYQVEASDDMGVSLRTQVAGMQQVVSGPGFYRLRFNCMERSGPVTMITGSIFIYSSGANTDLSNATAGAGIQQDLVNVFRDVLTR